LDAGSGRSFFVLLHLSEVYPELVEGSRFFLFRCLSEVEGNEKKSSNQVGLREIRD
jgi:hypothetical protein